MKRHLVMDLFYGPFNEKDGEWHALPELPSPEGNGVKIKVKLKNGSEIFVYWYRDIRDKFFECRTKEYFTSADVIQWINLKRDTEKN